MMMILKMVITLLASKQETIFGIFLVHTVSQLCLSKLSHFSQTLDVPLVPKPSLYLFKWLMWHISLIFVWTLSFNVEWFSLLLIFFSSTLSTSKLKRVNAVNQSLDFGMWLRKQNGQSLLLLLNSCKVANGAQ